MRIMDNDLFFTCSLIELMGRLAHQKRGDMANILGKEVISHIYRHADTLHCEPIAKTADTFMEMCNVPQGDYDNVAACKYTVPDYWTIGKVYARLVQDVSNGDIIDTLMKVYASSTSNAISNYNSDFFYQPRDFIKFYYLDEEEAASQAQSQAPAQA